MKCPHCQGELAADPQDPQKLLCYNCRKRYDSDTVNQYWTAQQLQQPAANPQPATEPQPYQPAQAYQPYAAPEQAAQAQPYQPQAAYAPAAQPQYPGVQQYPAQYPAAQQPYQQKPGKGLAIAALVLGILAAISSVVPIFNVVSIVMGLVAVILGIIAAVKAKKGTASGMGLGIAGAIFGLLAIIAAIVVNVLAVGLVDQVLEEETGANIQQLSNMNEEELNEWANKFANNLNENINVTFDNNGNVQITSNGGDSDYETFNNGAPAKGGWDAYACDINGFHVVLGQTTLRQLIDATPLTVDTATLNTLAPNNTDTTMLEAPAFDEAFIDVAVLNKGTELTEALDCPIVSISVTAYDPTAKGHYPDVVLPSNIKLGESTVADMTAAYGEDYSDRYHSSISDMQAYSYREPNNYTGLSLTYSDGNVLTGIEYSIDYL